MCGDKRGAHNDRENRVKIILWGLMAHVGRGYPKALLERSRLGVTFGATI